MIVVVTDEGRPVVPVVPVDVFRLRVVKPTSMIALEAINRLPDQKVRDTYLELYRDLSVPRPGEDGFEAEKRALRAIEVHIGEELGE